VTVQLINAHDGFHLWSQTFERELRGVFAVQDEITRGIVDALKIKLDVAPSPRPVQNTEAYDLYLQGLYFANKSDEASYRRALALFQQALDKDPTFGRAWTGIAMVWSYLADAYVRPLDAYGASQAAALKALAIDGRDAAAHCYLGEAKQVLEWDVKGRDEEEARALTLDPNFADGHAFRGAALITEGDHEHGMIELRQVVKLDPLSAGLSDFVCQEYTLAGMLNDAIAQGQRTLELDPSYLYFDSHLAAAYREKGRFADAIALYSRAEEATHSPSVGLAITYARMGRKAEAQQRLEELLKKRKETYFPADKIAMLYVALDKKEEAFRWLELAFREHSSSLYDIVLKSEFKPLRNDPRFIDLVKRIGLDPAKVIPHETP
jgi:tetratricopeptide (TPR) repeat protein